jgi:hypothetical protein
MSWNYTELWLADWQNGKLSDERVLAGREAEAIVTQPQWSSGGSPFPSTAALAIGSSITTSMVPPAIFTSGVGEG